MCKCCWPYQNPGWLTLPLPLFIYLFLSLSLHLSGPARLESLRKFSRRTRARPELILHAAQRSVQLPLPLPALHNFPMSICPLFIEPVNNNACVYG